jgi:Ca2+-transporting ATPase
MRKLAAVETLGSITYICSDKTGTLTQNKMVVQEIFVNDTILRPSLNLQMPSSDIFLAMALNNDAHFDKERGHFGDPTEVALCIAAHEAGYDKQESTALYPRIAEIPFDSDRKCMTTFHTTPHGEIVSYTKGAVEVLEEKAVGILKGDTVTDDLSNLRRVHQKMAADGLRVLGMAMRKWARMPADLSPENVEHHLILLGFVGMIDPPRIEVKDAIASSKAAGVIPIMITGDHPITARALAYQLGILEEDTQAVMTGRELAALSLEEFEKRVEKVKVYARTAPDQKLKIVKALQDKKQFVAMTGDGVNDAPALKRADIGVAMGITGTEVSKEASHMILLDDNFATIVKAIKEGRNIFDNIRKFIKYILSCNAAEILTIFLAPFFGLPIPLLPIQILWINLVTDSLPALALAVEPAETFVMKRPPRHPQEGLFAQGLGIYVIWVGLLMAAVCLVTQAWAIKVGAHWQTMVFTVLCLSQLGNAFAVRTERESLFSRGIHTNAALLGSVVLIFFLQLATFSMPFLNPIFKTQPLRIYELIVCIIMSSVVFFAVEITKLVQRLAHIRS